MIFILLGVGALFIISTVFRFFVLHPTNILRALYNMPIDAYKYIRYRKYNCCPLGKIRGYCGTFGNGKTLSMTHDIIALYKKYNNKKWYDESMSKWVTNKVVILTNIELTNIPYRQLVSLDQIANWCSDARKEFDNRNDIRSILIVAIDEASVQCTARNFANNFDADFIRSLMECRHHSVALMCYSAPRFKHVDAMLRQVTQDVYSCQKTWRVQKMLHFDAQLLEETEDLTMVKPDKKRIWFVRNRDYYAYDTYSCVANFVDTYVNDGFMSEIEKLTLIQLEPSKVSPEFLDHPSKKVRKGLKKYYK